MNSRRAKIAENTPPLSIRTPDGKVIATKYRNEHLAFMELLNVAEAAHKAKRTPTEGERLVWMLTDEDDADAVLATASIGSDGVLSVRKT